MNAPAFPARAAAEPGSFAFRFAILFIVCVFLNPGNLWPVTAPVRPALSAALLLILAVTARLMRRTPIFLGGARAPLWMGLAGVVTLSVTWALDSAGTLGAAMDALKLFAIWVALTNAVDTPVRLSHAALAMALGGLAPAWGAVQNYRHGTNLVEGYRAGWMGLFANPNELASAMVMVLPLTLTAALLRARVKRLALLGAAGLQVAAVVVTHSRGGALGLAAAMLVFALVAERKLRALGLLACAAAALIVFAPPSFWERAATIHEYETDASARGRLHAWTVGLRAIEERPLSGVGLGGYLHAWPLYAPGGAGYHPYAAHNMFLQVAAELGLLATACYVALLAASALGAWRARVDPEVGPWGRALLASLAGLCVAGLTGGYAFDWVPWLLLGLCGSVARLARVGARAWPRRWEEA